MVMGELTQETELLVIGSGPGGYAAAFRAADLGMDVTMVDPAERPTRAPVAETDREVFLDWDTALDDAGHLRRCVVCGCHDLFRSKAFPQITVFVVVLAFAGAVIGALGLVAMTPPILITMIAVLLADIGILLLSRQRLTCHRCRSSYHDLQIARYHRRWDRAVAERHTPHPTVPVSLEGRVPRHWWPWPARRASAAAATREERSIA